MTNNSRPDAARYQFARQQGDQLTLTYRSRTLDGAVEPDVALIAPGGRVLARSDFLRV